MIKKFIEKHNLLTIFRINGLNFFALHKSKAKKNEAFLKFN
jgi:hypothetical protein